MSTKFKVYCTYKNNWDLSDLKDQIDIRVNQKDILSREELLSELKGCHGIITNPRVRIDKEALDAVGDQLKVISTTSAGINHIDIEECSRREIPVGYLPDTFAEAVSEFAIGLVLSVTRKICEGVKLGQNMHWNTINDQQLLRGKPIRGSVIGIFGLGRIGLAVAQRLSAFGIKKVIYNNRSESKEGAKHGYEFVSFDRLLAESDILICCASLNEGSENKFNLDAFKKMKPSSVLVNVARGTMVNQNDLYEALTKNIILAAGIDVTSPEPLPNDHPLYSLSNCVITPHIGGDDDITREDIRQIGITNLMNGLNGIPLVSQVPATLIDKNKVKTSQVTFEKSEIKGFMERCMTSVGTNGEHAASLADCLIAADCRGHYSHGLSRLDKYVSDIRDGRTKPSGEPIVVRESPATALVDGNSLLGPVIGKFCMSLAIKKAKEVGIGLVTSFRGNHYGIAGQYSMMALKENLIGISMCNTSPIVFPTRSNGSTFGTNPISLAAPGANSDSFVLDMATTTIALGKLEIRQMKNSLAPIPPTWVANSDGLVSTNADDVLKGEGALFPLGGPEEMGGYKGYGLMFLVEVLTGILSGSNFGPHIRKWGHSSVKEANLGFCFIAINPAFFADNFQDRLQSLMDHCRNLKPIDPSKPVLVPGDPEREHERECEEKCAITYHINQLKLVESLAKELNVDVPKFTLS